MMAAGCASMHLALPLRRPRARPHPLELASPWYAFLGIGYGTPTAGFKPGSTSSLGYPFLHAVAPVPLCHSTSNYSSRHLERPCCANETQPDVRP